MSQLSKSQLLIVAAGLSAALLSAAPASAQYYYGRGYAQQDYYDEPAYRPRGYGPPRGYYEERRGYGPPQGYGQPRGYGSPQGYGQGGVYIDKETAKRNARALKEQQKDAIKHGFVPQAAPQQNFQQPRGGGGGYPALQPGRTAGQNGVPDDPYRNRN
jgi:hypothetical protein